MSDPSPESIPSQSVEYHARLTNAMETIRGAVMNGEVTPNGVVEFAGEVKKQPLVKFNFFDDRTGLELDAHGIIASWYGQATDEIHDSKDAQHYLDDQKTAADLVARTAAAYESHLNKIKLQYGPFAEFIDSAALISESVKGKAIPVGQEILGDPENQKFIQEVYEIALPNTILTGALVQDISNVLGFKKQ